LNEVVKSQTTGKRTMNAMTIVINHKAIVLRNFLFLL